MKRPWVLGLQPKFPIRVKNMPSNRKEYLFRSIDKIEPLQVFLFSLDAHVILVFVHLTEQ
jgi:hypothetical protein